MANDFASQYLGCDLYTSDWRFDLVPVHMRYEDNGDDPGELYYPCIRRPADGKKISAEEEYRLMEEQVEESKGFDIDFAMFRCCFNYQPVDFDFDHKFVSEETTRELIDRLSRESLEGFNEKNSTKYEFVKVIKANYHFSSGIMFYITFEAKLLSDDDSKQFQAKVLYCYGIPDFISCELKPQKKVHSIEAPEKEDLKKPRLTLEPSNV